MADIIVFSNGEEQQEQAQLPDGIEFEKWYEINEALNEDLGAMIRVGGRVALTAKGYGELQLATVLKLHYKYIDHSYHTNPADYCKYYKVQVQLEPTAIRLKFHPDAKGRKQTYDGISNLYPIPKDE